MHQKIWQFWDDIHAIHGILGFFTFENSKATLATCLFMLYPLHVVVTNTTQSQPLAYNEMHEMIYKSDKWACIAKDRVTKWHWSTTHEMDIQLYKMCKDSVLLTDIQNRHIKDKAYYSLYLVRVNILQSKHSNTFILHYILCHILYTLCIEISTILSRAEFDWR